MAYHYTLSNLFPEGKSFRVNYSKDNLVKSTMVHFEYGKTYKTNDAVLVKSLQRLTQRFPNTASNKGWLDKLGVAYDVVPCQACGGRVLKLEVHHFIVEEV